MNGLAEAINEKAQLANSLYHRLVLIVGAQSADGTNILKEVGECMGAPVVNVNLELSRRLLDMTERDRPRHVQQLLEQIVVDTESDAVLLNHIELLFDVSLRQNPLRLLQHLSRRRTVVAAWNGSIEGGFVRYSHPGHPEYRRYRLGGTQIVNSPVSTS